MNYFMVFIGVTLLYAAFTFYQGSRVYKETQRIEESVREKFPNTTIGKANYQGGFPPMPKLAKVTVGITLDSNALVMFNKNGTAGEIEFERILKIEKFTTKKNPDFKGRSVVLYGPLVPLIFKPKIAHFCIVRYIDIDNEENNLVLQSPDKTEIDQIYKNLHESWKGFKKQIAKDKNSELPRVPAIKPEMYLS